MFIRFTGCGKQTRKYFFMLLLLMLVIMCLRLIQDIPRYARQDFIEQEQKISRSYESRSNRTRQGKPVVLLYWSSVFRLPVEINNTMKMPFFYVNKDCDAKCELTVDKSRAMESDAIIIHARDPNPFPSLEKFAHIPLVLHTRENPVYSDFLQNRFFTSHFKYSISYRLDSHFPSPSFSKPSLAPPLPFKQKRMVLAVFSNCERVRTTYLSKLMQIIDVDSYGGCLNNRKKLVKRYQKGFKEKKAELSRYYKFTLVFMNADCDFFIDDQLTHALSAGSVPVFMGTDKVDEFLHGNLRSSIIKVRNYKTPNDLAKYLKFLSSNELEYNKYLKWKYEGFQFPPSYYSSPIGQFWESRDTVYCKLCKRLTQSVEDGSKSNNVKPDVCRARDMKDWWIGHLNRTTQTEKTSTA